MPSMCHRGKRRLGDGDSFSGVSGVVVPLTVRVIRMIYFICVYVYIDRKIRHTLTYRMITSSRVNNENKPTESLPFTWWCHGGIFAQCCCLCSGGKNDSCSFYDFPFPSHPIPIILISQLHRFLLFLLFRSNYDFKKQRLSIQIVIDRRLRCW